MKKLVCLAALCTPLLLAYQWPVAEEPTTSFLQQTGKNGGLSFGLIFANPSQSISYSDGEIIYRRQHDHPRAIPVERQALTVIRYQNWLTSYLSSGMVDEPGSPPSTSVPQRVGEAQVLQVRPADAGSSEVQIEFYDASSDQIISPWLLLPVRSASPPGYRIVVTIPGEEFRTNLLPRSYLRRNTYALLFQGPRHPIRIATRYDQQQIAKIDLSTVEQRQGRLYTNDGLTQVSDLLQEQLLEVGRLKVAGELREWHQLQFEANFDELQSVEVEYQIYTLPPPS